MALTYNLRPTLKGKPWAGGLKPAPSGGKIKYEPTTEAEMKWWLGKVKGRKKSTTKATLCLGGPYHDTRVPKEFVCSFQMKDRKGKTVKTYKEVIATTPLVFTVPPYAGRYEYSETENAYLWKATNLVRIPPKPKKTKVQDSQPSPSD